MGPSCRRAFFTQVAGDDTGIASTSPAAAKVLAALEYAQATISLATAAPHDQRPRIVTENFWERVQTLFNSIDGQHIADG